MSSKQPSPVILEAASQHLQQGRTAAAAKLLGHVRRQDPLYAKAMHLLALVHHKDGNLPQAVDCLKKAIESGENDPNVALRLAVFSGKVPGAQDAATLKLLQRFLTTRLKPEHALRTVLSVVQSLPYNRGAPYETVEEIFRLLVLPTLRWALEQRMYALALALEDLTAHHLVKQRETEEHFKACYMQWVPDMLAAGRRIGATLPALPRPDPGAPLKLGFLVQKACMLAHVEALISMLTGYRQLSEQPFEPIVYALTGHNDDMSAAFRKISVPVVNLATGNAAAVAELDLLRLRERLAADGVPGLVWLSSASTMTLAFAMRVAPVQIWWAMKYHGIEFDGIDEYVTSLSFARHVTINGRRWCAGRLQVRDRFDAGKTPAAEAIIATLRPAIILGTLGREEKLKDPAFLDAVSRILHDNPDTVFLWTGHSEHTDIARRFHAEGLADRTRFIGWVDIKVYAQVLDIFLDSFPFGCGFTALDAMAAGKPVVLMASTIDSAPSLDHLIHPLLAGNDADPVESARARDIFGSDGVLYQRACDVDDYVERASRLVRDSAARARAGAACRRFVDEMMSDPAQTAADYSAHFVAALRRGGF